MNSTTQTSAARETIPQPTLADRIQRAIDTTPANSKARTSALKAIRWTLRSGGQYVRLDGMNCTMGARGLAIVFDGRDNEALKKAFWEKELGIRMKLEVLA